MKGLEYLLIGGVIPQSLVGAVILKLLKPLEELTLQLTSQAVSDRMEASPPRIHCLRDDTEWVLEENPDIIIGLALAGGYERDNTSILKARYDEIRGTAGFSDINAGQNNKVFVTDPMTVLGPGNHIGVLCFAKWLYPELFNDLDPEKLHQEFIDKFQHVDFDLNKHGAFVYPPLNES